jgi:hypothetical protein
MDEKRAYATGDADFSFVDKRGDSEKQIVVPRQDDTDDIQDFGKLMGLYEESLESIQEGEIVKGQIVHIDNEHVSVDIGYKSEGQIPIREFMDLDGNLTARVGDEVEVLLERKEDRNLVKTTGQLAVELFLGSGEVFLSTSAWRPSYPARRLT